ncbi:MAG: protein O-GlcNAc transferase [Candidatus Paceibacteria bacterium]|jgi:protein O-GlcNAc transferase
MSKVKIQRNERCPCGSGKKYKQCCALIVAKPDSVGVSALASLPLDLAPALSAFNAGLLEVAAERSDRILELDPLQFEALHLRGLIDFLNGDFSASVIRIREAILLNPLESRYFYNLGTALLGMNNQLEAIEQFRMVIKLDPANADAHGNLAAAFHLLERYEEAKQGHLMAMELKPNDPAVLSNYAATLNANSQFREAIPFLVKALALDPDHVDSLNNLGLSAQRTGMESEAETIFRRAVELNPLNATAHFNLADTMQNRCRLEEAIQSCRDGLALRPSNAVAHSNLLLYLQYSSLHTPAQVFEDHVRFAEQFEAPILADWIAHTNSCDPDRRLKVGYVSADFRDHAVAFFIEPILANHDRSNFDVYCYYTLALQDAVTDRLKALVPNWVQCNGMSAQELAARIRSDGIDILIDLSGHTAGNSLLTFVHKPSPVQMTFGGYPGTTGLASMDYRITDGILDPVGETEQYHSEKLLRLPTAVIYKPVADCPEVNPLPALTAGFFTFGCLNNLMKISPQAIRVWSSILTMKPGSKLMIGNLVDPATKARILKIFEAENIGADRLICQSRMSLLEYLSLYQQIDLSLDTFPYTGGTTTNDSLWMGVPVLTLVGVSAASRSTAAAMLSIDLPQFLADSQSDYINQALALSDDLEALAALRQTIRQRLASSALKDPVQLTSHFETLLRQAWREHCV